MNEIQYTTRTVKCELKLPQEQITAIRTTSAMANNLYAVVVEECCKKQTFNYYRMSTPDQYRKYKDMFPTLPSMLLQQTIKEACGAVKAWNSKNPRKRWNCPSRRTALSYPLNKRTLTIRGTLLTFSTCGKRVRTLVEIPEWFTTRYNIAPSDVQAGTIAIKTKGVFIYLVYRVPKNIVREGGYSVGVDRGLYNICTLSDGNVISSKQAISVKRRYQHLRGKLQQKGTKSAKRKLRKLSGKEKRFMSDVNHCITKQLASNPDVSTYILEDLTGIRKQRKGKKLNSWLSNWSFYEFELQLHYKCEKEGINVVKVDPRYTSQKCNQCGNINKESRVKSRYVCISCGHNDHADINAAKNIRDNYALSKRDRVPSTTQSYQD